MKKLGQSITTLFHSLQKTSESGTVSDRITDLKTKLEEVTTMIVDLGKQTDGTENLGDMVESELTTMDKAIEEAASRIQVRYTSLHGGKIIVLRLQRSKLYNYLLKIIRRKCCQNPALPIRA